MIFQEIGETQKVEERKDHGENEAQQNRVLPSTPNMHETDVDEIKENKKNKQNKAKLSMPMNDRKSRRIEAETFPPTNDPRQR
jgi:hypothetical protein